MGGIWKKDTGRGWGQTQQGYQMTILHIKNEKKARLRETRWGRGHSKETQRESRKAQSEELKKSQNKKSTVDEEMTFFKTSRRIRN